MERKQPKTCVWVSAVGRERNFAKVSFRHSRHFSSFPRKRESRISDFQIIFEYCCCSKV